MSIEGIDLKLSKAEAKKQEKLDAKGRFDFEKFFEKNKLQVIIGGLGIFLLGLGILSTVVLSSKKESSSIEILPSQEEENKPTKIFIHVAGAVQKPGLYQLPSNARINDALISAGGLSSQADRDWFDKNINLAQKLSDGVKLYLPLKGEVKNGQVAGSQTSLKGNSAKINLNNASKLELESLSGIGPGFAQKIIDYRQKNGPFAKIEDLTKVSGIGDKLFQKIKDNISVF